MLIYLSIYLTKGPSEKVLKINVNTMQKARMGLSETLNSNEKICMSMVFYVLSYLQKYINDKVEFSKKYLPFLDYS